MNRYQVLPKAEDDLFEIWAYIARDNIDAADRVELDIRTAFLKIARNPELGHLRRDITPDDLLFYTVRSVFQIVYDPNANPLAILRILRGGRDVAEDLG